MLILHRSARADLLVEGLARLLADPLPDPVTAEVVAVPTRGVERWITQRLSHSLGAPAGVTGGVCANLDFPFPGSLVDRVTARATGIDPDDDPWSPDRLVWALLDAVDAHGDDPELGPLMEHLAATTPDPRTGRRYAVLRHVADLFDRYSVHRPELVRGWAAGPVEGGGDLPPGAGWQPYLWRLARRALGVPSPAERLADAVGALTADPAVVDLPSRLSVFGLTRLPAAHLAVLDAMASARDVHLFLLHPSDALWARSAPLLVGMDRLPRRGDDPTARLATHPLLRSWGRDAREMQVVTALTARGESRLHAVPTTGPPSLLRRIQDDVRADRAPGEGGPFTLDPSDRSVQVHSCHGRSRQVEVLRDAVLHLLADDPTLEARDVIVMCPDIETYAPILQAVFGEPGAAPPDGEGTGPVLRVRLADRSLRQTNPLLAVAALLLDLAGSRVTAPAVVDLAGRPAVARRFGLDQDDVATLERWISGTAVRWGLDARHRRAWALGDLEDNTWSFGLDRLLLGVAMAETGGAVFAGAVPYDDVSSSQVDLAGRLAELVARLSAAVDGLSGPLTLGAWVEALAAATRSLACPDPDESWQEDEFRATLADALTGGAGDTPPLTLDEIGDVLGDRLRGRPTRANFRTGDMTVCTLVPMRSVPHRVVALLGMDDGAFPRHPEVDGDDLLLADPRVGDRDARSEDRQLLLDALMAATDHLVVTYCGRDERTNRPRPPCAPVSELLDVVDATATLPDGAAARARVVCGHPLQPFDRRNFAAAALAHPGPWSFDPVYLAAARARPGLGPGTASAPSLGFGDGLPDLAEPVIQLEHLVAFVQHPARAFLRRRLWLYLGDWSEELDDRIPLELGPLDRWALGDRLLESVLAGADVEQAVDAERRRGFLPPGPLAFGVLRDVGRGVAAIAAALEARGFPPGSSDSAHVQVALADGRVVVGEVPHLRRGTIVECTYSSLGAKHRLAAWVRLLALAADRPDAGPSALTVGRGPVPGSVSASRLDPPPGTAPEVEAWAKDQLARLVDLYDRGMRQPIPVACAASAQWAAAARAGGDRDSTVSAAALKWLPSGAIPGERDQEEHIFIHGRDADFPRLLAEEPRPDETGPGWPVDERHRFGVLARRLWDPILDRETVSHG